MVTLDEMEQLQNQAVNGKENTYKGNNPDIYRLRSDTDISRVMEEAK